MNVERSGVVIDSLIKSELMMGNPPYFIGSAVDMPVYIWNKEDPAYNYGDGIILLEENGLFNRDLPDTWLKYNTFVDSTGNSISYSSEDLFVTK